MEKHWTVRAKWEFIRRLEISRELRNSVHRLVFLSLSFACPFCWLERNGLYRTFSSRFEDLSPKSLERGQESSRSFSFFVQRERSWLILLLCELPAATIGIDPLVKSSRSDKCQKNSESYAWNIFLFRNWIGCWDAIHYYFHPKHFKNSCFPKSRLEMVPKNLYW